VQINNPIDLTRSGKPSGGAVSADAEKAKAAAPAPKPAKTDDSATVKLSGGLDKIKDVIGATDAFDAKRVEELKAAINDGSFKVNAGVVADKLISSNLEALSRSKP
jgi:negative regulator of flagellin synthesis FlgM